MADYFRSLAARLTTMLGVEVELVEAEDGISFRLPVHPAHLELWRRKSKIDLVRALLASERERGAGVWEPIGLRVAANEAGVLWGHMTWSDVGLRLIDEAEREPIPQISDLIIDLGD